MYIKIVFTALLVLTISQNSFAMERDSFLLAKLTDEEKEGLTPLEVTLLQNQIANRNRVIELSLELSDKAKLLRSESVEDIKTVFRYFKEKSRSFGLAQEIHEHVVLPFLLPFINTLIRFELQKESRYCASFLFENIRINELVNNKDSIYILAVTLYNLAKLGIEKIGDIQCAREAGVWLLKAANLGNEQAIKLLETKKRIKKLNPCENIELKFFDDKESSQKFEEAHEYFLKYLETGEEKSLNTAFEMGFDGACEKIVLILHEELRKLSNKGPNEKYLYLGRVIYVIEKILNVDMPEMNLDEKLKSDLSDLLQDLVNKRKYIKENVTCFTCNKIAVSLKKCGKCKSAKYCSVDCQRKDWPQHKQKCLGDK